MKHHHMIRAGYLLIASVMFLTTTFIAQMQQSIIAIDLDWSSDGTMLLAGYNTGDVRVFDVASGQTLFQTQLVADGFFKDAAWSPTDNNIFAYAEGNHRTFVGTVSVIDVSSGQLIASFNIEESAQAIAWSPDGTRLAVVAGFSSGQYLGSRPIKVWNVSTGEIEAFILGGFADVSSVTWSPDGSRLASASADTTITIWDANTGDELNVLIGHTYPINDVIWSPDGVRLASADFGSRDDPTVTVRIWDAATGVNLVTISESSLDMVWNPDSNRLVTTHNDVIRIWDVTSGDLLGSIEQMSSGQIAWNPTGDILAFSSINNTFDLSVIQFPFANAGPDQTLTDVDASGSELVTLNASASSDPDGTIVSYEWRENGTIIATGMTPQVDLAVGVHTIMLTVTDDDGATGIDSVTITVQSVATSCDSSVVASDSASMVSAINTGNSVGSPYSICLEDSTYTLTAAHNSDWDGGNGLPVITGDITIVGNGAIIERASGSLPFRIFKVDDGGRLVLDGVTIRGGDADDQTGGGIRNRGTLEVINSVIDGNRADGGGGIRNNDNATLIVIDSTISNNISTGNGGGTYSNTGSNTTLTNVTLSGNEANVSNGLGGGLYLNNADLSMTSGTFSANNARNGGGLFVNAAPNPVTLNGVTFANNTANNHGGGIYASTGIVVMDGVTISGNTANSIGGGIRNGVTLTILNSTIQENNGGSSQGGGITNYSNLTLNSSALIGNYGSTATLLGGGIYNDGNLIIENSSLIDGTSTMVSSHARHGGGLYADGGTVTISASQIVNNVASNDGGGIMVRSGATLTATGLMLDNNTANDDGGGLANEGAVTFSNGSIRNNHAADRGGGVDTSTANTNFIQYSCIEGNTAANTTGIYSAVSDFDATDNWWGSTGGPSSSQVNNNVLTSPFVTTNCLDAQAMGGGAMALSQSPSATTSTIETVSSPYQTAFDERAGWLRSGTWAQEATGGRDSVGWVVDATIRDMTSSLEMPVFVDLGNQPNPRMRYWQRGDLSANDTVVLEILTQGTTSWTALDQQSDFSGDWIQREIDLSAYRGQIIRLRWTLTTAGEVSEGQQSIDYALDDLQITSRRN